MFVARFWGAVLAALLAVLTFAPNPARAEITLAPCVGAPNDAALTNPYGSQAIGFACEEDQRRHGAGNFQVEMKFAPVIAPVDEPLVFRMTSVWQDSAQLTFRYANGSTAEIRFDAKEASRYLKIGAIFEVPVPRRIASLTGITYRTVGTANLRGVILGAALLPRSESQALTERLIALYAGFIGLSIALIAYNLSLWAALRHRFQLLYCGMVAAISVYVFTSSGAVMQVFPALANTDRLRLNYVFLTLSAVIALWFIRHFFEERVLPRRLCRSINVTCIAALVAAVAFAIAAPTGIWVLDRFYFITMGALILMAIPVLYYARRNGSRHFWMFTLAWSAPLVTSFVRMLHGFGFVPYSFWLDNGNLIALAVEALLSSVLITARLRELSHERDTAREGEVAALRLANSDPLTGLMNRRAFMQAALGRNARQRLMLIDIDRFKDVNDLIGHEGGDEVLRHVAKAIQSVRPAESLAVRLGGEEFALLVPEERAFLCPPELVLEAVRCQTMPMELKVTVSLGYGEGSVATELEWTRLYRLADAALYRAKADGRDRASRSTDFTRAARA